MEVDHGVELPDVSNFRYPPGPGSQTIFMSPRKVFPQNFMCNRGYHFLPPHMEGRTFKLTETVSRTYIN